MSDSIIYEARPIPPDGPDGGRRKSAIIAGAALIILLLVGVALGAALFRGDGEPTPLAEISDQSSSTLPTGPTTVAGSPFADRATRGEDGAASLTRPGGPRGDATPTPALPAQEFTWEKITLDLPAGEEAYLQGVYAVDDGFIAVGMSWSESGQDIAIWRSSDGSAWEKGSLNGDFSDASIWNVIFNEYGGIAFGEASDGFSGDDVELAVSSVFEPTPRIVWTSPDGVNWTRSVLEFANAENQSVWLSTGVAGPDGFLVVGHRETSPEFTPVVIEKDGYQLILNQYGSAYQVLDASGAVVAQGSMDDIYGYEDNEEGQTVVNPGTGETLTVIPYEIWEQAWEEAYNESSGGPFGGFGDHVPPVVIVEHDGYRISVDEENFTYLIEDITTGTVIGQGNADYLWRGPAPVFTDASGTEFLRFSWEEFDAAQEEHWRGLENDEYAYQSELVVATSSDGITWSTATVASEANEFSFDSVVVTDGGYLAYGNQWGEYGGGPGIWASTDGRSWDRVAEMPGEVNVWNVQHSHDGTFLAIGDGPQGASLWSSSDGITWSEAFGARVPEDRSQYEWLGQFGTGELGTVVVGSREEGYVDEPGTDPLTLTQDEYTLIFDDYDWPPRVTVVDNVTGEVVIDEQLLEEGGLPDGFYYEDGVTYIENNDIVLMAITDEEWNSAQESRWVELDRTYAYQQPQTTMYFSTDLTQWTEVPVEIGGWVSTVAVGSNVVVLAGEEVPQPDALEDSYDEDLPYAPPSPVLFVGRP